MCLTVKNNFFFLSLQLTLALVLMQVEIKLTSQANLSSRICLVRHRMHTVGAGMEPACLRLAPLAICKLSISEYTMKLYDVCGMKNQVF